MVPASLQNSVQWANPSDFMLAKWSSHVLCHKGSLSKRSPVSQVLHTPPSASFKAYIKLNMLNYKDSSQGNGKLGVLSFFGRVFYSMG